MTLIEHTHPLTERARRVLADALSRGDIGHLTNYLRVQARLGLEYPLDALPISMQSPLASEVATIEEWKHRGREIRPGAKPILACHLPVLLDPAWTSNEESMEAEQPVVALFDVTQTLGRAVRRPNPRPVERLLPGLWMQLQGGVPHSFWLERRLPARFAVLAKAEYGDWQLTTSQRYEDLCALLMVVASSCHWTYCKDGQVSWSVGMAEVNAAVVLVAEWARVPRRFVQTNLFGFMHFNPTELVDSLARIRSTVADVMHAIEYGVEERAWRLIEEHL